MAVRARLYVGGWYIGQVVLERPKSATAGRDAMAWPPVAGDELTVAIVDDGMPHPPPDLSKPKALFARGRLEP